MIIDIVITQPYVLPDLFIGDDETSLDCLTINFLYHDSRFPSSQH